MSSVFIIRNVEDLVKVLIPILDKNPLHTVKYFDYLDFIKIVLLLSVAKTTAVIDKEKELAIDTIKGMNRGRIFIPSEIKPRNNINKYWLLGFIEGEGTFGMKNLVPYFQIGQHVRSSHAMENIDLFFKNLTNLFSFTLKSKKKSPCLIPSIVKHKNTNVLVYSYQNVDSLHDTLTYFLLDLPFQTRKKIDFLYWAIVLHMHKYGYFI